MSRLPPLPEHLLARIDPELLTLAQATAGYLEQSMPIERAREIFQALLVTAFAGERIYLSKVVDMKTGDHLFTLAATNADRPAITTARIYEMMTEAEKRANAPDPESN